MTNVTRNFEKVSQYLRYRVIHNSTDDCDDEDDEDDDDGDDNNDHEHEQFWYYTQ